MASICKVFLLGNLSRDPDFRNTSSGSAVCKLNIAVNRPARGGKDEVCFVDVTVWGKTAENCRQYLSKGSQVFAEGYLRQENWTDKSSGQQRSKLSVVAENIQFMSSGARKNGNTAGNITGSTNNTGNSTQAMPKTNYAEYAPPTQHDIDKGNGYQPQGEDAPAQDDIPF